MAVMPGAKSFSAILTRPVKAPYRVVIDIPFDVVKLWGARGHFRVKGEINGFPFQTSLFPAGSGRHFMVVNTQMRKGANVQLGMEAQVKMAPDSAKRIAPTVPELERLLKQSKPLRKFYESLAPSIRQEVARYIGAAKQASTRCRRADQLAERLMETMEAEIQLPPVLRQVMSRNPLAAAGWERMSRTHRRKHLLAIFYYRTWDARMRRIERAVEEMAAYAQGRET